MFNKLPFGRSKFGLRAENELPLYANVTTEYATVFAHAKLRVKMPQMQMNAVFALTPTWLYLYAHISDVEMEAEAAVIAKLGAKKPLGRVPAMCAEYGFSAEEMLVNLRIGSVTMRAQSGVETVLWAMMPIAGTVLKAEHTFFGKLAAYVPLPGITTEAVFVMSGPMYARMPLRPQQIGAEYRTAAMSLRSSESEEISLEGLNLEPGQRLIIDTDTMEISVDDEVRVDCWVTGGSFFQLKEGDNILTFSDNAANRTLKATVLWQDRFL